MGPVRQFPHLLHLDLSHNNIRQVDGIDMLTHLQVLNLSHNDLRNFLAIRPLSLNQSIRVLHLHNNVVATLSGYRARVSSLLPQAFMLDDVRFPRFALLKKLPSPSCRVCGHTALPPHLAPSHGVRLMIGVVHDVWLNPQL
ncbi:hypothetical protein DYB38_012769 [Aphanomyces astaci]|uniref:Leucine-rich repeat-containing protein 51 n=1 Tax=Aphanomyces astaci TaxID=112090 RepID=A0A397E2K4_APHAT|nr:hypothetical protein DYB38_012769 [Aphanomyces astaci]